MISFPQGSKPRIGLIQFPGSNCDQDCMQVLSRHYDVKVQPIWHQETKLPALDGVILPGGFSYGDYLRGGALAARSPITDSLRAFASAGGSLIGICNGFQVLTEMGILPGTLLPNDHQRFRCEYVSLHCAEGSSAYHHLGEGKTLRIPIAHGEGRYYADKATLSQLQEHQQIVYQYCDENGEIDPSCNPNGASLNIAGIVDRSGKILGMMPHPERAWNSLTGGSRDGIVVWDAFFSSFL